MSQSFFIDGQWLSKEAYLERKTQLEAGAEKPENEEEKELTKDQIIEKLTELNVEFKSSAKKAELQELLDNTLKLAEENLGNESDVN
jgi:hypothetical protein